MKLFIFLILTVLISHQSFADLRKVYERVNMGRILTFSPNGNETSYQISPENLGIDVQSEGTILFKNLDDRGSTKCPLPTLGTLRREIQVAFEKEGKYYAVTIPAGEDTQVLGDCHTDPEASNATKINKLLFVNDAIRVETYDVPGLEVHVQNEIMRKNKAIDLSEYFSESDFISWRACDIMGNQTDVEVTKNSVVLSNNETKKEFKITDIGRHKSGNYRVYIAKIDRHESYSFVFGNSGGSLELGIEYDTQMFVTENKLSARLCQN